MNIDEKKSSENEPISSGSTYALSKEKRESLTADANNGSKDAAFVLYQHFAFSNFNADKELHWLETAARNGHPVAQYNLAVRYNEQNRFDEALHWANEALKNGEEDAIKLIDEIKNK